MIDVLILGGGPGSLSAALYAVRRGLKTCLVTEELGGYVSYIDIVENYLGFPKILGKDLAQSFIAHIQEYPIQIFLQTRVKKVVSQKDCVEVILIGGKKLIAKTCIVALGTTKKTLCVMGEKKFFQKGISYCTVCDGPLFIRKIVAVIGGGNSGLKSALYLSKIAKKVYIIEASDSLHGESIYKTQVFAKENIEVLTQSEVTRIMGSDFVDSILLRNVIHREVQKIQLDGIFVEIGVLPQSDFILVDKDSKGHIIINSLMQTSKRRIFAVGDITNCPYNQISIAVGQGCIAALEAEKICFE